MIADYDQAKVRNGLIKPLSFFVRTANVQNGIFSCVSNVDCPSYLKMATGLSSCSAVSTSAA